MILNQIDFGGSHPWQAPVNGQMIGTAIVEGQATIGYARGAQLRRYSVTFWAKAWQGIGGQAANSMAALRYLLKQGEELADNRDLNPVYIQWSSSAETGAPLNAADQHDGWYNIESFKPDYLRLSSGLVPVQMTVALVATAPPRGLGQSYLGPGALTTTYSGSSQIAIGYPFNAANQAATAVSRTGGEGAIPLSIAPAVNLNPLPFNPSATLADWWKGGVRVWDTINTSSNAVPLAGLSVNANWVEVFQSDHRFEGDCVISNGLLLLLFVAGQTRLCRAYLWSTAQASPAWVQVGDLQSNDNAAAAYTLRSYRVDRIGLEETRIVTNSSTSGGNVTEVAIRLQRGAYFGRADLRPLSQSNNVNTGLFWTFATAIKIAYNSASVQDPVISGASTMAIPTDYGYLTGFTASTAQPFLSGLLNLNKPNAAQGASTTLINIGDTATPLQNAIGNYGFFAVPFGTSTDTTQRLQAECESGVMTGGYVSVVDAAGSNGHAAKLPSGTVATPTDFSAAGTFVLAAGNYVVAARVRTGTAGAGTNNEFAMGLHDGSAFINPSGKNLRPVDVTTSYLWYYGPVFTYSGNARFYLAANATTTVDWFIDEWVLMVLTQTTANTGPQEIWQQMLHDRIVRLTRI